MTTLLTPHTILTYTDQPQLFTATDQFNTLYLCLLYQDTPTTQYTAIRISNTRLQQFQQHNCDLRQLFTTPENQNEYFNLDGTLRATPLNNITHDRLPDEGYYIDTPQNEQVTITIPSTDRSLLTTIIHRLGWVAM
ncbi:MAG: hypothetical protein HUK04_03730 [Bacteroidaceae bacterium]|nr:hypothetical protein [Bacteroidaceae bacterium]